MPKEIVYKVEEGMDREKVLCTTYQMRNFYDQMRDGFFTNLDVMNYIQHYAAAQLAKKKTNIVDVCCGRSLMLPLLRYYAKDIGSYTGIDISKKNLREALRGAVKKNLTQNDIRSYYPFPVQWKLGNVSGMSKVIPEGFADFVIYTSAIEHMHKDDGYQSLIECKKIMNDSAVMFLSCPNTPGNGYKTQYKAHVYEWGYRELKEAFSQFVIGSMFAYYVSQTWDVYIFHKIRSRWMKKQGNNKNRWIWNNVSTATSQMIDTVLFTGVSFGIGFGWLYDKAMWPTLASMMIGQYVYKFLLAVLDTPFFYVMTKGGCSRSNNQVECMK